MFLLQLLCSSAQAGSPTLDLHEPRHGEVSLSAGYTMGVGDPSTRRKGVGGEVGVRLTRTLSVLLHGDLAPVGRDHQVKGLITGNLLRAETYSHRLADTFALPVTQVRASGHLGVRWAPIRGALSLANEAVIAVDFGLQAGVTVFDSHVYSVSLDEGVAQMNRTRDPTLHALPFVGVGQALRFNRSLGATWLLRGTMFRKEWLWEDSPRLKPWVTGGLHLTWWPTAPRRIATAR